MPTDFRVAVGFHRHPKTRKLVRRCGGEGVLALLALWAHATENREAGNLDGLSDEDIELACDWTGEAGAFIAALAEVGFLDGDEGGRRIHDWREHQPWVSGAPQRRAASQGAAKIRWHRKGYHDGAPVEGCPLCEDGPDARRMRDAPENDAARTENDAPRTENGCSLPFPTVPIPSKQQAQQPPDAPRMRAAPSDGDGDGDAAAAAADDDGQGAAADDDRQVAALLKQLQDGGWRPGSDEDIEAARGFVDSLVQRYGPDQARQVLAAKVSDVRRRAKNPGALLAKIVRDGLDDDEARQLLDGASKAEEEGIYKPPPVPDCIREARRAREELARQAAAS